LTPPGWQYQGGSDDPELEWYAEFQRALWKQYASVVELLQPVDVLIANGDLVDGRGAKTGGVEEILAERDKQARMAARCLEEMHAKRVIIVSGTPYHSSEDGEDWDAAVAQYIKAETIGTEGYIDAAGLVLHVKHFCPSSVIPHGRFTGPAREYLHLALRALHREAPRADVVIRSHVHYGVDAGNRYWRVIVTPCLQGPTRFPRKTSLRETDMGLTVFDIKGRDRWTWRTEWIDLPRAVAPVLTL